MRRHSRTYNPRVVAALAECIHILPTGACVDLSDGEKALVLVENAADFTRPMILKFSNNMIYDLSDPVIGDSLRVTDIMKTMDNRIAIDEEALEHFVADQYIRETADRFRQKKLAIAQRKRKLPRRRAWMIFWTMPECSHLRPLHRCRKRTLPRSGKRPASA